MGTHFTCFTGTTVQILTQKALLSTQFTFFTGTKVQILTQKALLAAAHQLGRVVFQSGVQDEENVKQVGFTGTKALAVQVQKYLY